MEENKKIINMMEQIIDDNKSMKDTMNQIIEDNKSMKDTMNQIIDDNKKIKNTVEETQNDIKGVNKRLDKLEFRMDSMEKTEKAHFEQTCNEFERLEKKIDSNFKYLDEKIDTTKEKIVLEVIDGVEEVSASVSKIINKVENKVDTEVKERKYQIEKLNNLTEYDKIVLKNLESRVSILEEEAQKYNGK